MIAAVNKLNIKNAKSKGDFVLSNIDQKSKIESKTTASMVQKIQTKVMNDLGSKLSDNITKQTEDIKNLDKQTNMGDIVNSLANIAGKAIDGVMEVAGKLADSSIGSSVSNKKTNVNETAIKKNLELNDGFKVNKDESINSALTNALDQKNIAKCAESISAGGEINLENIESTDGSIKITNIQQEAIIGSVTDCVFNQELLTEVSNKMIDSINKTLASAAKNVSKEKQGDLDVVGVAAAAVIASAGTAVGAVAKGLGEGVGAAAKGAGEGLGSAAKGAGEGLGAAAEGVGKGIGSVFSGMLMPIIIIAAVGIFLLFVLPKFFGGAPPPMMGGPPPMYGPPMGGPPPMYGPPMGGPPMQGPPMEGPPQQMMGGFSQMLKGLKKYNY
jgi:hypothetical protein